MRAIDEPREGVRILGAVIGLRGALDGHWLTQGQRLLAPLDVAPEVPPFWERRQRTRLNPSGQTLTPGQKLIAERIVVELLIGRRDDAGFADRFFKQFRKRCRWGCRHAVLLALGAPEGRAALESLIGRRPLIPVDVLRDVRVLATHG